MKTFQLDPMSWHYKLVMYSNKAYKWDCDEFGTDICTYSKKLFLKLFLCTFLIILSLSLFASYISLFVWIYDSYKSSEVLNLYDLAIPASSISFMIIFVSISHIISNLLYVINEKKNNYFYREKSQPSFIKLAYRSWKDKYCIKLEVMKKE